MLQVLISCGFKGNSARKLPVRRGVGGLWGGCSQGSFSKSRLVLGSHFQIREYYLEGHFFN